MSRFRDQRVGSYLLINVKLSFDCDGYSFLVSFLKYYDVATVSRRLFGFSCGWYELPTLHYYTNVAKISHCLIFVTEDIPDKEILPTIRRQSRGEGWPGAGG